MKIILNALGLWFSNLIMPQNHLETLSDFQAPLRVSKSVSLGQGLRLHFYQVLG